MTPMADGEGRAKGGAEIERGRENAARSAAAQTDGGGNHLKHEQQRKQADCRHLLVEDRLDDRISNAVDVGMAERTGEADHHQSDDGHADDVLRVDVSRQLREAVLHDHEQADEGPGGDAAEQSEQRRRLSASSPPNELRQRELDVGHGKGRIGADQDPADRRGRSGRDDDRKKRAIRDLRQQDLEGEQHAAERRVEGGGDAGAGARRSSVICLPGRQVRWPAKKQNPAPSRSG